MKEQYIKRFEALENSLNGESKSELHKLRKEAIAKFGELDFPTTKNEEWKYTNVAPIFNYSFKQTDNSKVEFKDVEKFLIKGNDTSRVVIINGNYSNEHSKLNASSNGVKIESLAATLKNEPSLILKHLGKYSSQENGFTALNTAFIKDGYVIIIPDNAVHEEVVHIINITTGSENVLAQPRNLIIAGKNSHVELIETYHSLDNNAHLTNSVTEIVVDEDANVGLFRIQQENENSFQMNKTVVSQHSNSVFTTYTVTLGGRIVRNDLNPVLNGEHIESNMYGLYVTDGEQHVDNHTSIDHAMPNCNSNEMYKGILSGKSRAVFNGKVFVRKDAQKTNAYQSNKNILLSKDATVDTKPQLEIFADDVKCSHGATVGQLDDLSLFYLRSRGIDKESARKILVRAFANDIFDSIKDEELKQHLNNLVFEKLV